MNEELKDKLEPLLTGRTLSEALTILPFYDEEIREKPAEERLTGLDDIYDIYISSEMSAEIYNKLYLAMYRSMEKKYSVLAVKQGYQNMKMMRKQVFDSVIGGSDCFTVIGNAGIGKTKAISRAAELISGNRVIELSSPFTYVIPCLTLQCPFDCSVKSMLLEILRNIDLILGTEHYNSALRSRCSADVLIGTVSQLCMNHIGLLVIDEIQNVTNNKNGTALVSALTQLINNSGTSICMVGTPEVNVFLAKTAFLARRATGMQYTSLKYDDYFKKFCKIVYGYQYTREKTHIDPKTTEWLYEHSGGIISNVISLIHDAQEIAIIKGMEQLNIASLRAAYEERMYMLHSYIAPGIVHNSSSTVVALKKSVIPKNIPINDDFSAHNKKGSVSIQELYETSKAKKVDYFSLLREHYTVEEIKI